MRTTVDIDPSVLEAVRSIAAASRKSIGAVISELALRGIRAGQVVDGRHPVFSIPSDAQPLDPVIIRRLIDNDGLPD